MENFIFSIIIGIVFLVIGILNLLGNVNLLHSYHRDNVKIFEGPINNLKRFKDDAKEVSTGYECGISVEGFTGFAENDEIESYIMEEVK